MKKPRKRAPGRPPAKLSKAQPDHVKDLILNAFFELCVEEGIEFVTLQKIADRSGVALTSVRYHYQLQGMSLTQVAIESASDTSFEFLDSRMLVARKSADFDPVLTYMKIMFDWLTAQPLQASFLVYYYYLSTTKVPLKIENKELTEIAQRRILGLIHEGIGMKLYKVEGSAQDLSVQIQMIVLGACISAITSRNVEFSENQKDSAFRLVTKLLSR